MLWWVLACVSDPGDTGPSDTADTADTAADTGSDSGDTAADTADTAADAGTVVVAVTLGDGPTQVLACGAGAAGQLDASYDDALGNTAGRVRCAGDLGTFELLWTNGRPGAWTDPDGGVSFSWTDAAGAGWRDETAGRTAWSVTFDRYERQDVRTLRLEGAAGAVWGPLQVEATVAVNLACTNCP